jgi:hypothetical protein
MRLAVDADLVALLVLALLTLGFLSVYPFISSLTAI